MSENDHHHGIALFDQSITAEDLENAESYPQYRRAITHGVLSTLAASGIIGLTHMLHDMGHVTDVEGPLTLVSLGFYVNALLNANRMYRVAREVRDFNAVDQPFDQ